jgi:hypothetical protein
LIDEDLSPIFEAHLSKFRKLMPSLSLIFCLIESLSRKGAAIPQAIDSRSVELAIDWCNFLESHAKRAYGEHLEPGKAAARHLLKKLRKSKSETSIVLEIYTERNGEGSRLQMSWMQH